MTVDPLKPILRRAARAELASIAADPRMTPVEKVRAWAHLVAAYVDLTASPSNRAQDIVTPEAPRCPAT